MASTYTTNNKLDKQGVGDNANTWGIFVNTDLNLIDASLDGITSVALTGASSTLTMLDGATSSVRSRVLRFTGALTANHTITVAPNTIQKWWLIRNSTTGGFSVIISQGSGSTATIPASTEAIVMADGAGAGAAVIGFNAPYFAGTVTAAGFSGSGASLTSVPPSAVTGASHVRATTATAQSLANGVATLAIFGSEEYDTLGEYNAATGRFTALSTGYYRVSATMRLQPIIASGVKTFAMAVYRNGSAYAASPGFAFDSTASILLSATVDTTVYLSAAQYIEIFITQTTGAAQTLDGFAINNHLVIDRII